MKHHSKNFKWIIILLIFTGTIYSCDNHRNAADMTQLMAKNEIVNKLHNVNSFDITGFKEEMIHNPSDTNFKNIIQYVLDITYIDSNKILQRKKGIVFFTPDGKSIINSQITDN
ncbi:MAG TPA: hypothetical protein VMU83_10585 [Hanamia sp.]|nr:hypothetical protein [Hanamia sp.]